MLFVDTKLSTWEYSLLIIMGYKKQCVKPYPLYHLRQSQTTLTPSLCKEKRSFKPNPTIEHDSVKQAREICN